MTSGGGRWVSSRRTAARSATFALAASVDKVMAGGTLLRRRRDVPALAVAATGCSASSLFASAMACGRAPEGPNELEERYRNKSSASVPGVANRARTAGRAEQGRSREHGTGCVG
eukprot:CAMPEP_0176064956 /NCGR_PEP_ID=MMETSP0120_2-20121206/32402_1 /TAXON_ID=160619 /ORGANISM="Kryptoperidinium foliaceum, Strain CCMP 1326" /LENGTH=114 /DNA_ID=CAMNT_0017398537 /DNA_START=66 /DNA_END=408 /DNA_ORIENTATION=-